VLERVDVTLLAGELPLRVVQRLRRFLRVLGRGLQPAAQAPSLLTGRDGARELPVRCFPRGHVLDPGPG